MYNTKQVYVIGAGGHAKVVISTLKELGYQVKAIYDDDCEKKGDAIYGIPVLVPIDSFYNLHSVNAIIAIGDNRIRRKISQKTNNMNWIVAVHPQAYVHSSVRIGPGSIVFAGAIVQPDSVIGSHTIVNTGATVDHDCKVGNFAHIAPGVHLGGSVHIGEGSFIGMSSSVVPNKTIGEWSIVGAGASVIHDIPSNVTAVGVPAHII